MSSWFGLRAKMLGCTTYTDLTTCFAFELQSVVKGRKVRLRIIGVRLDATEIVSV